MATTYGSTPGVEVTVRGVAITGVVIGQDQYTVLFGRGDTDEGTADQNTPVEVNTQSQANQLFGTDSHLAQGLRQAIANGANASDGLLYGVSPTETEVTGETVPGGNGTLANSPIVEDTSVITVTNTSDDSTVNVNFVYEDAPDTADDGAVNINPHTGEVVDDGSGIDLDIDYRHLDWQSALNSADNVLNEKETGIYACLSDAESVASQLSEKVRELRDLPFKMVRGIAGAEPNATADGSETGLNVGDAKINVDTYTDDVDNLAMYLIGPSRISHNEPTTLIGAVAGLFSGHELTNPVYKESLNGVEPLQILNRFDRNALRDESQVIPLENEGEVRLYSNTSTDTSEEWKTDFHRVRIADQVTLIAKEIGDNIEGDLNNINTQTSARGEILGELEDLVADGLLEPNSEDDQNYYVQFVEPSPDEIAIDMGFTPVGVVKTVTVNIGVDT